MKSILPIYLFTTFTLLANYYDSDIDGVEDKYDQCDNTPFDELVDEFGCSKDNTQGNLVFTVGTDIGIDTFDKKDTTYNFALDYTINDWSMGISNSSYLFYETNDKSSNKTGDMYSYIGYEITRDNFSTLFSFGAKIAIADVTVGTGENDYYISTQIEYLSAQSNIKYFTNLAYTFTGDTSSISYKDIFSYNIGLGYNLSEKYYTSVYYENSQSIYQDSENYQALVWANHYNYEDNYFVEFDYIRALDKLSYRHMFSFKIGVSFE